MPHINVSTFVARPVYKKLVLKNIIALLLFYIKIYWLFRIYLANFYNEN